MTTPDDEGFGRIFDAKQGGDIDYLLRALTDPIHRSTAARYLGQLNVRVPETRFAPITPRPRIRG